MKEAAEHDLELQQALALSLQESQVLRADGPATAGPSGTTAQPRPAQEKQKQQGAAQASAASQCGSRRGRKGRKPASYDPSPAEVGACFRKLDAEGSGCITAGSLVQAGRALGQELEFEQAAEMLAYVNEAGVIPGGIRGALGVAEFEKIVDHFRVKS